MVTSLAESRSLKRMTKRDPRNENFQDNLSNNNLSLDQVQPATDLDEEIRLVQNLNIPSFDVDRKFPGIEHLKVDRKERHMKLLDKFTKFLDVTSERLEIDLLDLSRNVRENLEKIDAKLSDTYKLLENNPIMTAKSEDEVSMLLKDIKGVIQDRLDEIDCFANKLNGLEAERAEVVGSEIKKLTDGLINIAHQLPDKIEHIVESETFDLNKVLTVNRKSHDQLLAMMRKLHIEREIEGIQLWEDAKQRWRLLRHNKTVKEFCDYITSNEFTDPEDRQAFMAQVRESQILRQNRRSDLLDQLAQFNAGNINSAEIVKIQQSFTSIAEDEIGAIQDCYNQLTAYRGVLNDKAAKTVESLRKELHKYGALHPEPMLREIAAVFKKALVDDTMTELWRLGGGLKPEFQGLQADLLCTDVVYDWHISGMQDRLDVIVSSFNLKEILEERGRLMTLDRVRSTITKLRSVQRYEIPEVLTTLTPDLEEIISVEKSPAVFKRVAQECLEEINRELARSAEVQSGIRDPAGEFRPGTSAQASQSLSQTSKSVASSAKGSRRGTVGEPDVNSGTVDPMMVKQWSRKLGILYYGSDLPVEYQQACKDALASMHQQRECNIVVDEVVLNSSHKELRRIDKRYKKVIDLIANYLEIQASILATTATNFTDFFINLAKATEFHRVEQIRLDDKSMDDLWDWKETFRLEKEEKELQFDAACLKIKESTSYDELNVNFESVLALLMVIQESYRSYHGFACFIADKHPLSLAEEFKAHLEKLMPSFEIAPDIPHPILTEYSRLFDNFRRLNKAFVDPDVNDIAEVSADADIVNSVPAENTSSNSLQIEEANQDSTHEPKMFGKYYSPNCPYRKYVEQNELLAKSPKKRTGRSSTKPPPSPSAEADAQDFGGIYNIIADPVKFIARFAEEKQETISEPSASENAPVASDSANPGTSNIDTTGTSGEEPAYQLPPVHPDRPWLLASFAEVDETTIAELAEEELEMQQYEEQLANAFVALDNETIESLDEHIVENYRRTLEIVERTKERIGRESNAAHVRENPPKDPESRCWIEIMELWPERLRKLVEGIRDSLFEMLEMESNLRIKDAEVLNKNRKFDLTEELEDRLRTHWSRRGRVETQIKQPREAELLTHEEKTWRHIQSIQNRMIGLQEKFKSMISGANETCENYKNNMTALKTSLTAVPYRTLAALQGVDLKARNVTLTFQAATKNEISSLRGVIADEVVAATSYAVSFMKLCPLQEPGKDGGYSQAELQEIEELIKGQCEEILAVQNEWTADLQNMISLQEKTLKQQDEFSDKYDIVAQELALSEGLGQKYGAPRRRAQERLRTEVSRDENNAGKIDEILAKLDFICTEEPHREHGVKGSSTVTDTSVISGASELAKLDESWQLMFDVRKKMQARITYLKVSDKSDDLPDLPWINYERPQLKLRLPSTSTDSDFLSPSGSITTGFAAPMCLEDVVKDVDVNCRKETVDLYTSEGKADALGPEGIPASLQAWLVERREKLLGRNGYHEKAWKRLWGQVDRLETILERKEIESEEQEKEERRKVGVPVICLRYLQESYTLYVNQERVQMQKMFEKVLAVLEREREKNERFLRPRLGSPDAVDELNALNAAESERSSDMKSSVVKFQTSLIRRLFELSKIFFEDVGCCAKGLVMYLDTSLVLEVPTDGSPQTGYFLRVPPDVILEKKRMTLKRLRKAQRIRHEIEQGKEDISRQRMWPAVPLEPLAKLLPMAEPLIDDLEKDIPAPPPVDIVPAKGKGKPPAKGGAAPPPAEPAELPSLLSKAWKQELASSTCVYGTVSHAHRAIMAERNEVVSRFVENLQKMLESIKETYGTLLDHEKSWNERWMRLVDMLRSGDF